MAYLPAVHLPTPIQKSFSFSSTNPSSAPFSYSHPLPNPPKLHTRIAIPKVLPFVRDEMATPVHLQYNSPMGLYSRESAEEQYSQQMGGVGGGAPIPLPNQEKHFDATKSKVLQEIQRGDADHFGESFAEQIARAETPKIFNQQEPMWAEKAREKSERARSRTPGGREYTPSDPFMGGAVGYPYQHKLGSAGDEAREYAEKSRSFVHANHGEGYGPAYYQVQSHSPRHRSRSESSQRGYELGGMDFAGRGAGMYYENPEAHTYVDLNRKHRETSQPPIAGSDFGTGAIGYGAYHGHGPDPPRLRSKYTADPKAPVNLYVAPNVDSVDGNLLIGDTLSNQKVAPRVSSHSDGSFGTSFAPPQGHRPDHRTYRAPPKPEEPVTFCVSAPKMNGGYSSAPSHQTDVFTQRQAFNDKEVSPHTLLTDEALRPRRREHTPDWVNHSLSKQQQWKHLSDPRLDKNLEVYYTEPNWKRNVDQRKNAWERRAFETEQQLQRPKAPASGAPYWANRSEQMHNTWARAADDVNRGGHGYQNGGVQHHDYSTTQSTQNYSSQQSQPAFGQSYPSQTTTHFSQPLSVGFGGNQLSTQKHSPGGYSVHTQSQSGDKNTGNYATSEHFERERNEDNRHEKSSYTHSESKSTTVNGQPVGALPAGGQTFHYANGGVQNSQQFQQQSHHPSHVVPPSSFQNFKSSSFNTSSNTQNQTTRTLSPRPPLNTGPLTNHHVANGVETDILNTGFNENQVRYFEERHAVPTPHHHHSPLPQKTQSSSTVALPGGGHRYTNFSSESTGVQGGPAYSTNEKYLSETRDPNGRSYQTSSFSRSEQKSSSTVPAQTWQPSQNQTASSYNENFHKESNKRSETTTTSTAPVTRNTTYSYAQQPLSSQMSPGQTRYEHYSMKKSEEKSEETRPIPLPPPQPVQETRYEQYSSKRHEEKSETTRPVPLPPPQPVQETRYEHYSMKKHEEKSEETRPIPLPPPQPVQESRYEHYSMKRHEEKSEETRPIPLPPPQPVQESRYEHYSMKRHEEKSEETRPIPLPPPQPVQESRYEHYSMKRHEEKSEETRPIPLPPPQPVQESRYEHYSMKRHEEKSEETRPIPLPPPQPVQESRYEHYSMKKHEEKKEETRPIVIPAPPPVQTESRYEKYSSNRHEETKTESRPVSQQSNYTERREQDYHKSSNEKTTTTSTSGAPRVITSVSSNLNNDAFDRKAEMAEQLPRGSISNTHNNTQGGYRDHSGHDVSYKRELATSSDPGRDVALLKEEEKRVIEKPLEPGVISRHVTTKYYKKKTTTDTTTTTTPTN